MALWRLGAGVREGGSKREGRFKGRRRGGAEGLVAVGVEEGFWGAGAREEREER